MRKLLRKLYLQGKSIEIIDLEYLQKYLQEYQYLKIIVLVHRLHSWIRMF